jgi:hypothetical protein
MPKPLLIKIAFIILINSLFCTTLFAQSAVVASTNITKTDSAKSDSIKKATAKKPRRAKNVFIEVGGPGLLTVNYDTRFFKTSNGLGARLGLGYIPLHHNYNLAIPAQINYLIGKKNNFFEIGAGVTLLYYNTNVYGVIASNSPSGYDFTTKTVDKSLVAGTMTIGYRYQPAKGGFNFRAAFTPIFSNSAYLDFSTHVIPFAGISFGYTFKNIKSKKVVKPIVTQTDTTKVSLTKPDSAKTDSLKKNPQGKKYLF